MTWQELGALGELVGAFAAVALLGYIAYQIRQNSRLLELNASSTQAASLQAGSEFYTRFWTLLAQDATLAGIWRRAQAREKIDEDETIRFQALLHVMLAYLEHAYLLDEMGTYGADVLALGGPLISELFSLPPARDWWQERGQRMFRPAFSAAINRLLEAEERPAERTRPAP